MGHKKGRGLCEKFFRQGATSSIWTTPRGLSRRMNEYESTAWQTYRPRPGLAGNVAGHFLAMGVFPVGQAHATSHNATRSISETRVAPGSEVMVTINVSGYVGSGLVEETLPAGFSLGTSNPSPFSSRGVVILWAFQEGLETIEYTVTAPSQPDTGDFRLLTTSWVLS